ncbi:MAG: nitrilase-related carbon-nitrogen hydrolase [Candidatus Thermoplasmatota archaeon]
MAELVRCGLIQASAIHERFDRLKKANINKHLKFIERAWKKKVKILCLQELFYSPYFPAEQNTIWYGLAEKIPDGETTKLIQKLSDKYNMVIIAPIYEKEDEGIYYNTAIVVEDGRYIGKYRKNHIPNLPGFWEKFYFKPGNIGYPVFETRYGKIGVYICYDRHFPEGARILALKGAKVIFNPSATIEGLSKHLWELEQPAHAVANGLFFGAINRVGIEKWKTGKYYGSSYFCDPRGKIIVKGSEEKDELVIADLDLDIITEVRNTWQFFRDRRPETYNSIVEL